MTTIIILLILAGITISQLSNSGLFEKVKLAKKEYKNAQEDEEDKINKYSNEIDSYVDGNRETVTISNDEYDMLKNANSYSTTEKKIGNWIDGKSIYKKVIQETIPNCSSNGTSAVNEINVSTLNIDKLISTDALIIGGTTFQSNLPLYSGDNTNQAIRIYYATQDKQLLLRNANKNYNGFTIYITIQYTKTTDTASN